MAIPPNDMRHLIYRVGVDGPAPAPTPPTPVANAGTSQPETPSNVNRGQDPQRTNPFDTVKLLLQALQGNRSQYSPSPNPVIEETRRANANLSIGRKDPAKTRRIDERRREMRVSQPASRKRVDRNRKRLEEYVARKRKQREEAEAARDAEIAEGQAETQRLIDGIINAEPNMDNENARLMQEEEMEKSFAFQEAAKQARADARKAEAAAAAAEIMAEAEGNSGISAGSGMTPADYDIAMAELSTPEAMAELEADSYDVDAMSEGIRRRRAARQMAEQGLPLQDPDLIAIRQAGAAAGADSIEQAIARGEYESSPEAVLYSTDFDPAVTSPQDVIIQDNMDTLRPLGERMFMPPPGKAASALRGIFSPKPATPLAVRSTQRGPFVNPSGGYGVQSGPIGALPSPVQPIIVPQYVAPGSRMLPQGNPLNNQIFRPNFMGGY